MRHLSEEQFAHFDAAGEHRDPWVVQHLQNCSLCALRVKAVQEAVRLAMDPTFDPWRGFTEAERAEARNKLLKRARKFLKRRRQLKFLIWVVVVCAFIALLATAWFLLMTAN